MLEISDSRQGLADKLYQSDTVRGGIVGRPLRLPRVAGEAPALQIYLFCRVIGISPLTLGVTFSATGPNVASYNPEIDGSL